MANFKFGFYNFLNKESCEILKNWGQIFLIIKKIFHKIDHKEEKQLCFIIYVLVTGIKMKFEEFSLNSFENEVLEKSQIQRIKQFSKGGEAKIPIFYEENNQNFEMIKIKKGIILDGDFLTSRKKYKKLVIFYF